jgi:phage terminase Nu1 subunit (DNA packaging protein)
LIVTRAELLEIFDASDRVATNWVEEGMPVVHQGGSGRGDESTFDVGEVHRWLLGRAVAAAKRETADSKLRELQAQELEIRIIERTGGLVSIADLEPALAEAIITARNDFLQLGDRLKERIDAEYRINLDPGLIEVEIITTLTRLSEKVKRLGAVLEEETTG